MKSDEFAACAPEAVLNQPPALENYNLYECDRPLREALAREGGDWIEETAREFGALLGKSETLRRASWPIAFRQCFTRTIASVIASTKLSFIQRGTSSCN